MVRSLAASWLRLLRIFGLLINLGRCEGKSTPGLRDYDRRRDNEEWMLPSRVKLEKDMSGWMQQGQFARVYCMGQTHSLVDGRNTRCGDPEVKRPLRWTFQVQFLLARYRDTDSEANLQFAI